MRRTDGRHRLRDLDRRGKAWAGALAVALLLAPCLAFAWAVPRWVPANDPAIIAFRALDVGTERTPLIGQPSTAGKQVEGGIQASHPGPLQYYLLAPAVRWLGASVGMPAVSAALGAMSLLVAAWAVFRQLGPAGGVVAAVVLGGISFTTGAAWFVNPTNSVAVAYPMLAAIVLLWCLLCGDLRLLPLTVLFVSFSAQQHLGVLPTIGLATGVAVVGCLVRWARLDPWSRWAVGSEAQFRLAGSTMLGLVLWSPVLVQQIVGRPGNLEAIARFARSDTRGTVGVGGAARQLAHVLALPPLVGRMNLSGEDLLSPVSPVMCVSAVGVVAVLVVAGCRWWTIDTPGSRRAAAGVGMAGVLAVAGMINGSAVPTGLLRARLDFYHWVWPLTFFVALGGGLAAVDVVRRSRLAERSWALNLAVGLAVLAVAGPAVVNPGLDRRSNTLDAANVSVERPVLEQVRAQVLRYRAEIAQPTMVLVRGQRLEFDGVGEALALALTESGVEVKHTRLAARSFHPGRVADPTTVHSGLILWLGEDPPDPAPPGQLIADVDRSLIERLAGTLPANPRTMHLRVYLLDHSQLLAEADPTEL